MTYTTYRVTACETLMYEIIVKARSIGAAEQKAGELWAENQQAFRCISYGGLHTFDAQKTGGGQ